MMARMMFGAPAHRFRTTVSRKKRPARGRSSNKSIHVRFDVQFISLPLIRPARAITTAVVAALGTRFRFIDVQLASIQLLAI